MKELFFYLIFPWILVGLFGFITNVLDYFVETKKEDRKWVKGPVSDTVVSFFCALMFGPFFFLILWLLRRRSRFE